VRGGKKPTPRGDHLKKHNLESVNKVETGDGLLRGARLRIRRLKTNLEGKNRC